MFRSILSDRRVHREGHLPLLHHRPRDERIGATDLLPAVPHAKGRPFDTAAAAQPSLVGRRGRSPVCSSCALLQLECGRAGEQFLRSAVRSGTLSQEQGAGLLCYNLLLLRSTSFFFCPLKLSYLR